MQNLEKQTCSTCHSSKAQLHCGVCKDVMCKYCVEFNDEDQFALLPKKPLDLSHLVYCRPCYDRVVAPELKKYSEQLATAKNILVYYKKQGKETRLFKRLADPVFIKDCKSSDEVLMSLAFQAVLTNHNAIIDVDVVGEKVRNGTYQTMTWSGSAMPTYVNEAKIIKDRSHWSNPN